MMTDRIDVIFLDEAVGQIYVRLVNHTTDQWVECWLARNPDGGLTIEPEKCSEIGISPTDGAVVRMYDRELNELPTDQKWAGWPPGEGE